MEKLLKPEIDIERRIKDIHSSDLKDALKYHLQNLHMDFRATFTVNDLEYMSGRMATYLQNDYKGLMFSQVLATFQQIVSGNIKVNRLSIVEIMGAIKEMMKQNIENNKIEAFKSEPEHINILAANCNDLPLGSAIMWKIDQKNKTGIYPDDNLKDIVRAIKTGEISVEPIRSKKKRKTYYND